MDKWEWRFMDLAHLAAGWSKDPVVGVGAVVADDRNRVVSLGFNGFPPGVADDHRVLEDRPEKGEIVIHAEDNAIAFARGVVGCRMFVTRHPCPGCAGRIVRDGIRHVVFAYDPAGQFEAKWKTRLDRAREILSEGGVTWHPCLPLDWDRRPPDDYPRVGQTIDWLGSLETHLRELDG